MTVEDGTVVTDDQFDDSMWKAMLQDASPDAIVDNVLRFLGEALPADCTMVLTSSPQETTQIIPSPVIYNNDSSITLEICSDDHFIRQIRSHLAPQNTLVNASGTDPIAAMLRRFECASITLAPMLALEAQGVYLMAVRQQDKPFFSADQLKMLARAANILGFRLLENAKYDNEKHAYYEKSLILQHLPSGFALHRMQFDPDGTPSDYVFLDTNPAFENMMGIQRGDIIGKRITELFPEIKEQRHIARLGKVVLTGESDEFESYIVPLDRHYHIVAFKTGADQFATIVRDVTARKEDTKHLEKLNDVLKIQNEEAENLRKKAEEASAIKSDFLANMSHEVRTPLNGIIGITALMEKTNLDKTQAGYVEVLQSCGDALMHVVEDILDFSKIERNKLELERTVFDFNALLEGAEAQISPKVALKKLKFQFSKAANLPRMVIGDPRRIKQILMNICENAVEFTSHGSVSIVVQANQTSPSQTEVRFSVTDTGCGISSDKFDIIFDDFTQINPDRTREHDGMGLGLAIVKQLVELMDGELGVQSELHKGSTFWFVLPLHSVDNEPGYTIPATSEKTDIFKELRVLVAEDSKINQKLTKAILDKNAVQSVIVENGVLALEKLDTEPFDLVLMDIKMPQMDGITATREFRARPSGSLNSNVPIVALTANAEPGDRERFLQSGMNDYISKPVAEDMLRGIIGQHCIEQSDNDTENKTNSPKTPPPGHAPVAVANDIFNLYELYARVMNDEELLKELIHTFVEDVPEQIKLIQNALIARDYESAARAAHSIKGASANMAASNLKQCAFETEQCCLNAFGPNASQNDVQVKLSELTNEYETTRQVMKDTIERIGQKGVFNENVNR